MPITPFNSKNLTEFNLQNWLEKPTNTVTIYKCCVCQQRLVFLYRVNHWFHSHKRIAKWEKFHIDSAWFRWRHTNKKTNKGWIMLLTSRCAFTFILTRMVSMINTLKRPVCMLIFQCFSRYSEHECLSDLYVVDNRNTSTYLTLL